MYEKVAKLLNEKGISLYELSKQTEIPMSTLSNFKNREGAKLSAKYLVKVADFLGITLDELLREDR